MSKPPLRITWQEMQVYGIDPEHIAYINNLWKRHEEYLKELKAQGPITSRFEILDL